MVYRPATRKFRALAKHFWRVVAPPGSRCWICGHVIDQSIPDPRDKRARSIDHVVPLASGGAPLDVSLWRPAHLGCNSRRGNGRPIVNLRTSRQW